ncbi:reverse transcriptase domain-containing protein [Aeromonas caviae]|uniref:reverse transcriptase domain-containing protein n=1 Tax=Aeromonas caviae TaxID=648 RepID=UPI002B46ECC4|nr:reverse transcriptase domain-containing protein [Aeromonas caviae]
MTPYKLFKSFTSKKNLKQVYENYIKNKPAVGLDKINSHIFSKRLDDEIDVIHRKIRNKTYHFTTYKQKLISKGANKYPRCISIPTIRDRITLKILCELLQALYKEKITQEIPQTKIERIKNSLLTGTYSHYIKIDLANFYPSIHHEQLLAKLSKNIRSKQILNLIESALQTATLPAPDRYKQNTCGIPQGIAISNILADIYFIDIDERLSNVEGIHYERYVDDIFILCKEEYAHEILRATFELLISEKLEPHPIEALGSKSKLDNLNNRFSFLGYEFHPSKVTVKSESRQKLESSIVKLFTTYKYQVERIEGEHLEYRERLKKILQWRVNLRLTGCIFEGSRRGWVFYFSQINDQEILYKIDRLVYSLCKRFTISDIHFKKISKAYLEAKIKNKDKHKYIINFDKLTVTEKRKILTTYLGEERIGARSNDEINRLFKLRIKHIIAELEQDIQSTY